MNGLDRHTALAHGRGHSFDGAVPHITRGKHTGDAGLQQVRGPLGRCCPGSVVNTDQILAGENEAMPVAEEAGGQPFRMRLRAN